MWLKNKRVYIAGHSGMVGSALHERLISDGVTDLITASHNDLDLCNQGSVDNFFSYHKPDVVLMAAGVVGGIVENRDYPGDFISKNLSMQLNTILAARKYMVERFVFLASSCMYPRETQQPMAESQLLTGSMEPTSQAYAIAKLAGLQLCLSFNHQDGGNRFIPVIPNTIYGPNDNFDPASGHVLPALITRFHQAKIMNLESVTLWGSGRPVREFVYVNDVVDALIFLLDQPPETLSPPYNIGSGQGISIAELALHIATIVGFQGDILWDRSKPDGAPKKVLDASRLQNLGWRSHFELTEGISNYYEWYLEQLREML